MSLQISLNLSKALNSLNLKELALNKKNEKRPKKRIK